MVISIYLPLLCAALLAAISRPVVRWCPPTLASRVLTAASLLIALATVWAVGLLVALRLCLEPAVAAESHLTRPVLASLNPVPAGVCQVAAVALLAMLAASMSSAARRARSTRQLNRLAAGCRAAGDLVVLPSPAPLAFALPGRDGRIVVSSGMLRRLDGPGRAVLLAHERAHLEHRHDLFRTAVALAAALNPLLRGVAADVRFALERWADEAAAEAVGDRRRVARTLITAASTHTPPLATGFAFNGDRVAERVEALRRERHTVRPSLLAACALAGGLGVAAAGDATGALARLLLAAHG